MELKNLYTLSQLVDYVEYGFNPSVLIIKYNDFLKQPLTKEMFVNPLEQPLYDNYMTNAVYGNKVDRWREAEKQVIFKDSKRGWCEDGLDVFEIDSLELCFNQHTEKWHDSDEEKYLVTLHDLAEATQGELTLKNVTI